MYPDLVSATSDRSAANYGLVQVCTHTLPLKHSVTQSTTFTTFHDGDRGSKKVRERKRGRKKEQGDKEQHEKRKEGRGGVQNSSYILLISCYVRGRKEGGRD